ncbi:hypothetical protein SAPIO_CDS9949 [Scedosporium apiospermum]|uniref:Autophagy-related protein 29 n=1 Tax=Pseudallescheria apiosperma TaxID=563466 RepID=A0A084FW13_PSEDA|nr:uncharacterized protein SAPIO_CDS9949 [Scedosporium apiospermum]KEZ39275.1 hypothetical protein SAPIO_CDS9949 [Scedosporium apiospermum]
MPEPLYRVFVRVPIPRGDFVDPPPTGTELAARFEVTVDFLIRQVAYLTEQHASQVRDELRKAAAAAKSSAAPSPVPGSEPFMGHQRTISALSLRRDSPFPRNETSGAPGTPVDTSYRPNISRNPSGNSPFQHNLGGGSTPRPGKDSTRGEGLVPRRRISSLPMANANPPSPGPADTSSDDSDDSSPAQSRIIRRPPRFQSQDDQTSFGDDEDDAEPAFQAFNQDASDLASTLRGDQKRPFEKDRLHRSQTSDSSTGSAAIVPRMVKAGNRASSGPLSPRAAQLSGRSGSGAGKTASREGSEGTPSMGSSFSDLDDSSVTQSAMAEALAAGLQDGAIGSRLSIAQSIIISGILRSGV